MNVHRKQKSILCNRYVFVVVVAVGYFCSSLLYSSPSHTGRSCFIVFYSPESTTQTQYIKDNVPCEGSDQIIRILLRCIRFHINHVQRISTMGIQCLCTLWFICIVMFKKTKQKQQEGIDLATSRLARVYQRRKSSVVRFLSLSLFLLHSFYCCCYLLLLYYNLEYN